MEWKSSGYETKIKGKVQFLLIVFQIFRMFCAEIKQNVFIFFYRNREKLKGNKLQYNIEPGHDLGVRIAISGYNNFQTTEIAIY